MSYSEVASGLHKRENLQPIHPKHGLAGILSPEVLLNQKAQLKKQAIVPAMPGYDKISLLRNKKHESHEFVDFMVETRRSLHTLDSKPVGNKLLSGLNNATNYSRLDDRSTVIIEDARKTKKTGNRAGAEPDPYLPELSMHTRASMDVKSESGLGAPSIVGFNSDIKHSDGPRPSFIGLGHELVHAYRNQMGVAIDRKGPNQTFKEMKDELETVGILQGPKITDGISENSLRIEHGISERTSYSGQTKQTYINALKEQLKKK